MPKEETVIIALTQEQQAIVNAVLHGLEERMKHDCYFESKQRKKLHDFIDAIESEGADHETHIIVFRLGNSVKTNMKKLANAVMWAIIIIAACAVALLLGRPILSAIKGG